MDNKGSLSHSHSENNGSGNSNGEQSLKRRKILEQKKITDQLIDVACAQKDHLSPFPSFRHYNRGGLSLYLQSGRGDKLSYSVKKYIQNLLKINMEGPYGSQWPTEEKVKHREMVSTQARYIFVHEASNANANGMPSKSDAAKTSATLNKKDPMVAFVHFRFIIEEMIPVLYVYELQIEPRFRGRGMGTFLMELIELIACKNSMGAVVFTVQKANFKALNFYQSKLRYAADVTSLAIFVVVFLSLPIPRERPTADQSFPKIWPGSEQCMRLMRRHNLLPPSPPHADIPFQLFHPHASIH